MKSSTLQLPKHVMIARASLAVVSLAMLGMALALIARGSGMPTILGRYSTELFIVILLILATSFTFGIVAFLAPIRIIARVLLIGASIGLGLVLLDLFAYLLAPVLPHALWNQMPYQIKKRTYSTRPEVAQIHENTVVEQNYWAFEPYRCHDWPLMYGSNLIKDEDSIPTYEVCHDEIGFRNPVGTYTENEFVDVVTLGDSFTYGYGARQGWPDQFRERSGLTVLNLAQTGGSIPEWIGAFSEYGMDKTPSIVIATTWDANDFVGLEVFGASAEETGNQREIEKLLGVVPTIHGSSPLLQVVDYSLSASLLYKVVTWWSVSQTAGRSQEMSLSLEDNTEIQLWINRRPDVADDARWELYRKGLSELATLTENSDSKLVLVYFTTASVVYAPHDISPSGAVLADVENNRMTSLRLAEISATNGIWYFDTTPILQKMAANSPLLYAWDGHFTQEGYDAVAEIIYDYVIDRNLLEANQ